MTNTDAIGWQPIETAPRDGTKVDLSLSSGERVTDCWWQPSAQAWFHCWWMDDHGPAAFTTVRGTATHWQPLPTPPDVVICADLVALSAGIDLDTAVAAKFNATSEKVGLPNRLTSPEAVAWRLVTTHGDTVCWYKRGVLPPPLAGTRRWSRAAIERAVSEGKTTPAGHGDRESPYLEWKRANAR